MASPRVADRVGQVLGGRYRLIAPIGTGASASVYLGDDVTLRRRVAVKVLHAALADDDAFLRRFRAEAQAAAALNHPHVMAVHDWGYDEDVPFLVTEFLGGGDLRSMLDRHGPLSPSQVLQVGLETARGLDYAHRQGLVHRDIKPANLLFDDEGRLRIADFGLARALAEAAWTEPMGAVLGTARYASPEQARGEQLDGRSDVYSLAVVLVEAATGEVPFSADTALGTLMGRVGVPLPVPEDLGALAPVISAAGVPEPAERPDAAELGAGLYEAARTVERPEPLPLVGTATIEAGDAADADPTAIASVAGPAVLGGNGAGTGAHSGELEVPSWVSAATATAAATTLDEPGRPDERDEPDGPDAPRRRRRWPWVVLALLLVAGLAGGGFAYWWAEVRIVTHEVPALVGSGLADAEAVAADNGWELAVTAEAYDDVAPAGEVLSQRPEPGTELAEEETLAVTVSLGPAPVPVPGDLAGLPLEEAAAQLEEVGLALGDVDERHDEDVEADHILALAEDLPEELPYGSKVPVVVSIGPEPRTIPEGLTGRPGAEVRAELEGMGLVVAVTSDFSEDVPEGDVLSVAPGAGGQVERGGEVTVQVSDGPPVVTVPDVSGDSVVDAASALEGIGLVVSDTQGSPTQPVTGTSPAAGETVRLGTSVTLLTG